MVAKSCNIQKVQNLRGIIKEISYFFNLSPKAEQFLKDVKILFDLDTTKEKLIDVSLTRWMARINGLVVFETFFTIIIYALEKMKDTANLDIHKDYTQSTVKSDRLNGHLCIFIEIFRSIHHLCWKNLFWPTLIERPTLELWTDLEKFEI